MRILFLGNNKVGWQVVQWLGRKEQIVGVVVHPPHRGKYRDKIIHEARTNIFDGSQLQQAETLERIKALQPDIGVSVLFGYILKPEFLELFPAGVINLHPAYLPYNRGAYPNVWSIVEGTPAGVTLHYIDTGVDTGDIIAQQLVSTKPTDTGKVLYRRLEQASFELFKETWPLIRSGQAGRVPQDGEGTHHYVKDVEQIDHIDLDRKYVARELINIIRARSFVPHLGAYFIHEGHRVYLHLQLSQERMEVQ